MLRDELTCSFELDGQPTVVPASGNFDEALLSELAPPPRLGADGG